MAIVTVGSDDYGSSFEISMPSFLEAIASGDDDDDDDEEEEEEEVQQEQQEVAQMMTASMAAAATVEGETMHGLETAQSNDSSDGGGGDGDDDDSADKPDRDGTTSAPSTPTPGSANSNVVDEGRGGAVGTIAGAGTGGAGVDKKIQDIPEAETSFETEEDLAAANDSESDSGSDAVALFATSATSSPADFRDSAQSRFGAAAIGNDAASEEDHVRPAPCRRPVFIAVGVVLVLAIAGVVGGILGTKDENARGHNVDSLTRGKGLHVGSVESSNNSASDKGAGSDRDNGVADADVSQAKSDSHGHSKAVTIMTPAFEPAAEPFTDEPTLTPSTMTPVTSLPTYVPTPDPSSDPTLGPSIFPTVRPTSFPSAEPTIHPTNHPSYQMKWETLPPPLNPRRGYFDYDPCGYGQQGRQRQRERRERQQRQRRALLRLSHTDDKDRRNMKQEEPRGWDHFQGQDRRRLNHEEGLKNQANTTKVTTTTTTTTKAATTTTKTTTAKRWVPAADNGNDNDKVDDETPTLNFVKNDKDVRPFSLGPCEGDCGEINERQCMMGLVCHAWDGTGDVPGCGGVAVEDVSYCVHPHEEEREVELRDEEREEEEAMAEATTSTSTSTSSSFAATTESTPTTITADADMDEAEDGWDDIDVNADADPEEDMSDTSVSTSTTNAAPTTRTEVEPTPSPTAEPTSIDDYCEIREGGSGYGAPNWGEIPARDTPEYAYWIKYEAWVKPNLDENSCDSNSDRQSPIDLRYDYATAECLEYHEIKDKKGAYVIEDEQNVRFQILPTKLRIDYVWESQKATDENSDTVLGPSADIPKGWGDQLPVLHIDIKVPSEHTIEGKRYAAEYQIFLVQNKASRRGAPAISVLFDLHPADMDNSHLQRALDMWQRKFDSDRLACDRLGVGGWERRRRDMSDAERSISTVEGPLLRGDSSTTTAAATATATVNSATPQQYQKVGRVWNPWDKSIFRSPWFFGYEGSLTEPPCTEFVEWRIIDTPAFMSRDQLRQIKSMLFGHVHPAGGCLPNTQQHRESVARPTQALMGRPVHRCTCRDFLQNSDREWYGRNRCWEGDENIFHEQVDGHWKFNPDTKPERLAGGVWNCDHREWLSPPCCGIQYHPYYECCAERTC